jgi:hypothetical protein
MQAERAIEAWLTGTLRTKRDDAFPSFDLAHWGQTTAAYLSSTKKLKKLNWKHFFSRAVDFHNQSHTKSKLDTHKDSTSAVNDPRSLLVMDDESDDDVNAGKQVCPYSYSTFVDIVFQLECNESLLGAVHRYIIHFSSRI